jgi:hypothetical protein
MGWPAVHSICLDKDLNQQFLLLTIRKTIATLNISD